MMELSKSPETGLLHTYKKHVKKTKSGKIQTKAIGKSQTAINITLLVLVIATVYGFLTFDYKDLDLLSAIKATIHDWTIMFTQAKGTHFNILEAVIQVLITMALGFLTTLVGALVALILGLFAAKNLSNGYVSNAIKAVVAFIRAVPTVLWVLIFAVSAGLGSVAAVLGMAFHSAGYLIKAYSETFEEIDSGVIEALKASGANWWQIVSQAVLPSTGSSLLAWTFIRFEINFTTAVAMGAAAGAGGIGFDLFMAGAFYFDMREVGLITYLILALALLLESVSTKIKTKYLY